ncbi:MAG: acyl-ACP--UDP-N-acetylglucosamine O-acyltransferase [Lautropia sp.]
MAPPERIHPTALVDPGAELADDVRVGAHAMIGADCVIGAGCVIGPHAIVEGPCRIGRDNRIHSFAVVGGAPQDKKYAGEPTALEIGDRNTIREYVTINRGTVQDVGVTRLGDDNWIMAYVHIAHDCQLGSHVTIANTVNLAGHVVVEDWATLGGYTGVHQFCKIGAHVMTGIASVVVQDVPTYVLAAGNGASARGINAEGLKRRGFDADDLALIKRAYRILYRSELRLEDAKARLADLAAEGDAARRCIGPLLRFLDGVTRGIVR